eukprot:m.265630 g.265630  ORF g.265630 m.265630 type:complete len:96 (+) comp40490_c0_seq9:2424-2711(+)
MMGTLVVLSFSDVDDMGYNSLVDRETFKIIVLTLNTFFFIYVTGKLSYAIMKTGRKVKSKYGRIKCLMCLVSLADGDESEDSSQNEYEPLLLLTN